MGVKGLWDLLAPVGRRVSVETLAGKKLAIDASIWMIQFMKAMRDEKGEMVRNAHLIGFFRRICKLLYLRTKPVFVFDGATPALKRRTVIARRRQRENAQAKIRKTAEKLLLNQLKAMKLKELAKDLENQRKNLKNDSKGKKILLDQTQKVSNGENNDVVSGSYNCEKLDEMIAASIAAEEDGILNNNALASAAAVASAGGEEDIDEDEDIILPVIDGNIDPAVLAALPPSMQLEVLMRERAMVENRRNEQEVKKDIGKQNENLKSNAKGKEILTDEIDMEGRDLERNDGVTDISNQEKLDEMLAASLVAEQDRSLNKNASTSASVIPSEEEGEDEDEDEDEDEEMILPAGHGNVDPAVLASLPPSMQLDLLVQMRERLMAENRQKYQKVKKAPEKFSELQIEAYLKTVAFRREIDQVQKAAAGKDVVGGLRTSRIASEANREFIFSSSFTGDKQLFTSSEVQKVGDEQQQKPIEHPSLDCMCSVASSSKSNTAMESILDESGKVFENDVETYLDERGRIRVSKVRAMGMRMTRDLQRNLDLMKEIEQERMHATQTANAQSALNRNKINVPQSSSKSGHVKVSRDNNDDSNNLDDINGKSISNNNASIQISFEVDSDSKCVNSDDDMFACLVTREPVKISSGNNSTIRRQASNSYSDSDWEEGIIEGKGSSPNDMELGTKPFLRESNIIDDDSEVEWEDGGCEVNGNSLHPFESGLPVSKAYLEEEADLQEAIKRSLEDLGGKRFNHEISKDENLKISGENAFDDVEFLDQEVDNGGVEMFDMDVQQNELNSVIFEVEGLDGVSQTNVSKASSSQGMHLKWSDAFNHSGVGMQTDNSCERDWGTNSGQSSQDANKRGDPCRENESAKSVAPLELKEAHLQSSHNSIMEEGLSFSATMGYGDGCRGSKAESGNLPYGVQVNEERNDVEKEPSILVNGKEGGPKAELSQHFSERSRRELSTKEPLGNIGVEQNLDGGNQFDEKEHVIDESILEENESVQVDLTSATLEEEILNLGQERVKLGDEQRKLERNAESVNSEMFAECQELLQMFGLPYIIAPMEAEAQCAYMEIADLVDGVVTDDSDVFLFGARNVYKNIFDDRKYVETYFMKDIEKELGLTREKLINMALLLGSDYTEGVSGIGIVNAIEVVNAFPEEDGLHKFREWIESPDPSILGNFGVNMMKKGFVDNDLNCGNSNVEGATPGAQNISQAHEQKQSAEMKQIFMDKHRNVSKNWHIPSSFPSESVISAYVSPQVDKSTDPFTWGKPDLHLLRRLCWEKFGWGTQKSDELLVPVLNEYDRRETQLRLEAFYTFNERFAKIRSKRIKKAVKGITGNINSNLTVDDAGEQVSKTRKKRKVCSGKSGDNESENHSNGAKENAHVTMTNSSRKSTSKPAQRRQTTVEPVLSEGENPEQQWQTEGKQSSKRGPPTSGRGRGRGKGRGRGRRRGRGNLGFEQSDSSSGGVNSDDEWIETHIEKSRTKEVRRSTRLRKPADYAVDDLEIDVDRSLDQDNEKMSKKEAVEQGLSWAQGDQEICDSDVAADLNVKKQQVQICSIGDDFPRDYLEKGGGFCKDEDEVGQPGVSPNTCSFEADVSKDYLTMGGGFCLDENEMDKDQGAALSPATTANLEIAGSPRLSGLKKATNDDNGSVQSFSNITRNLNEVEAESKMNSSDTGMNMDQANASHSRDHSKVNISLAESTKDEAGASRMGGLSAMPNLKRKRRRN